VYWLRRIPAETRIVVLVVFLALFQAILLSVFGLDAIRRKRSSVAESLAGRAQDFLRNDLAIRAEAAVRARADSAYSAAFDVGGAEWPAAGGDLFTDAFLVHADGRIEEAGTGLLLWMPRELVDAGQGDARKQSLQHKAEYRAHGFDDAEKAARNLAFAEENPFLLDELGSSLSLLHAATPLFLRGETQPDAATLLRMRRIGVLNRAAGYAPAQEVDTYLASVDEAAGADPDYAAGRKRLEAHARVLGWLVAEKAAFRPGAQPALHRNLREDTRTGFYVRPVGTHGDVQVLAVEPQGLAEFLVQQARAARGRAPEGVLPEIVPDSAGPTGEQWKLRTLPGYTATARVSPEAILRQAAEGERFYWYIIGFSVAGILAGGLLTARAVMREVKLAKLKAGFVSNVTHGLKTPLTSIRMFCEMLRNGQVQDEEEKKECLDVISQETERLARLIQQVLDFGRLDARRRPFHWVVGPLEPIVSREAARFRRATGLTEEQFVVRIAVNTPPATHDPDAFAEVVANLLSNAWKYSPADRRHIELTLGPQRGRVVLAVEDNGPGVPPRERRKIFDQFYRSDDLLTREVEGTGLGLAIASNIVRAHGGRILVEGGASGGSRFLVVLPAAARRVAPQPAESKR